MPDDTPDTGALMIAARLSDAERRALLWLPSGEADWRGPAPRGMAHALARMARPNRGLTLRSKPHPVTRLVDYSTTEAGRRVQAIVVAEDVPR